MNKLFVAVFVVAIGASYGFLLDSLPGLCKVDKDCGAHKCCALGRICLPKLGANMPCEGVLGSFHKCGCQDGLDCKVVKTVTLRYRGEIVFQKEFKQCKAADEVVNPEVIDEETEQPSKKRGILTGITDTIFRRCSEDSECGIKSCCSSIPYVGKICRRRRLQYMPCLGDLSHCCGAGLECRSYVSVSVDGKKLDVKLCQKPSDE